jgi:hypothetical protein
MTFKRFWMLILLMSFLFLSACTKKETISIENELPRFLYETLQRRLSIPIEEITIDHLEYVYIYVEFGKKGFRKDLNKSQNGYIWISFRHLDENQTMFGTINFTSLISEKGFEYSYLGTKRSEYERIIDSVSKESLSETSNEYGYVIHSYKKIQGSLQPDALTKLSEEARAYAQTFGSPVFDKVDIHISTNSDTLFSVDGTTYHKSIDMHQLTPIFKSTYGEGFEFKKVTSPDGVSFYTYQSGTLLETETGYLSFRLYLQTKQSPTVNFFNLAFYSPSHRYTVGHAFKNAYGQQTEAGTSIPYHLAPTLRVSFRSEMFKPSGPIVYREYGDYMSQINYNGYTDMRSFGGMVNYVYQLTGNYPVGAESVFLPRLIEKHLMPSIELVKQGSYYEGFIDIHIWTEFWDLEAYPFIHDYTFGFYLSFG